MSHTNPHGHGIGHGLAYAAITDYIAIAVGEEMRNRGEYERHLLKTQIILG
jgi:hypothetical protein